MTTSVPFVQHIDTKSNIESIVGPIGVMAFASDTLQFGRYNGSEWVWTSPTTLFSNALRTPMGFERTAEGGDPYDCELSYNPATRTVSVYAVSGTFSYWLRGELYTASSIQAVHPDATGMYFFYIDGASQTTVFSTTPWDIFSDVLIAAVYYNADLSDGFAMNERHGAGRDLGSHYADHYKRGAFYVTGQGLGISGYTLQPSSPVDTDNQLSVSSGYIHDEDIRAVITGRSSGSYKIMSRSGASGVWTWENNNVPLLAAAGGYVYYNEWTGATWQQTQVANNKYVNYYVIATPSINSDFDVFMLMGQAEHSSLGGAEAETFADLDFGDVVFQEILSIYKITFRTNSSYVTEGECRIEGVEDTRQTTGRQAVSAPPAINHNSLGGLQGGIAEEYYHLELAEYTALTAGVDASTYHVHDGRYYTEVEVDGAIATGVNAGIAALIAGANTWVEKQTFSGDIAVTTNIEVASRVAHLGDRICVSPR